MEDEYQTSKVPDHACIPWWHVALMNSSFSLALPTFVGGLQLAKAASGWTFITGTVAAGIILSLIAGLTGIIGSRTRLSSYMLARIVFGTRGSMFLNLGFALSLLGWFGVNIELFSDAMMQLLKEFRLYTGAPWPVELAAGLLMTLTTFIGLRAINRLALLVTPLLGLVTLLMLVKILDVGSLDNLLAKGPKAGLPIGDVVSAIMGAIAVGAVIMPDICRFIRHWRGAVGVAIAAYLLASTAVTLVGGLAGLAMNQNDILAVMLTLGLGLGAFAIIFGGSWTINALNLYSAVLSIGTSLPRLPRGWVVILCGLGGTICAFFSILDRFIPFLIYLAIIFIPIGGILIVDFFWLRPAVFLTDLRHSPKAVEWPALLAWGAGTGIALLTLQGILSLTGVVALDAMFVAGATYGLLRWRSRERMARAAA